MVSAFYFSGTSYSGYEAAVYSAASNYYQQQQQQQQKQAVAAVAATAAWTGNTFTKKTPFQNKQLRPKQPPKPPQIHYCDVCKISCAGPQVSSVHPIITALCQICLAKDGCIIEKISILLIPALVFEKLIPNSVGSVKNCFGVN